MQTDDQPQKLLEPGTLDKTRRNIGPIDADEALEMQKKLGGQILKERSVEPDDNSLPSSKRRARYIKASGKSSSELAARSAALSAVSSSQNDPNEARKIKRDDDLPDIPAKEIKLMDKLMMSTDYELMPDYGFFNFLFRMSPRGRDRVQKRFAIIVARHHVEHIEKFADIVRSLVQATPEIYRARIAAESDLRYKFLRTVSAWSMRDLKVLVIDVENAKDYLTIPMLIPFVRAVYKLLLQVYYIGDKHIANLFKQVYDEVSQLPESNKAKVQTYIKQASSEWLYVSDQIVRGMYPFLMRMCSDEFVKYPDFFKVKIKQILKFLGVSQFDLLVHEKKKKDASEGGETSEGGEAEEKKDDVRLRPVVGAKDEAVSMGMRILDQLFPKAGFRHLETHPDMFPYFNKIYGFEDGYNVLAPENPLQVTIVLILIVEDFFKGCRNIKFNLEADDKFPTLSDTLDAAMEEWASYYEDLFAKKLGDYIRMYVNSLYSQKEYEKSKFGKETLNNILWRIKYYYLPHYKFSAPVLQKPINDRKYKALSARTDFVRTAFSYLVKRIDESAPTKAPVMGILNPWSKYTFDLPNPISRRIDVLLGANRSADVSAATNANLIKYTYYVMAVLDWWVNNPSSPAYDLDTPKLFRISEKDGGPVFSVPERTDQNQLFAEGVKKAIEAKKNKG